MDCYGFLQDFHSDSGEPMRSPVRPPAGKRFWYRHLFCPTNVIKWFGDPLNFFTGSRWCWYFYFKMFNVFSAFNSPSGLVAVVAVDCHCTVARDQLQIQGIIQHSCFDGRETRLKWFPLTLVILSIYSTNRINICLLFCPIIIHNLHAEVSI